MNSIYLACKTQNLHALSFLLSPQNINSIINNDKKEDGFLDTPLLYAIKYNKTLLLNFIIANFSQEINFDVQDIGGNTPSSLAILKKNFNILETLVSCGTNLCIQNYKQKDAIDYLIDKYFDILHKKISFNTLSGNTNHNDKIENDNLVNYILYNDKKHVINKYVLEVIYKMIKSNILNSVICSYVLYKLVFKLISIYKEVSLGVHKSEYFFKFRQFNLSYHSKLINVLSKSNLDINANIEILDVNSPFFFTLAASDIRSNQWIKKAKKQKILFSKNQNEQNILMYACINNRSIAVNKLTPYFKRKINDTDLEGNTALNHALNSSNYASVQILLFNNADINIKNKQEISSLDIINSLPKTLNCILNRDFKSMDINDLIDNYLAEFIDCFCYNPKLNIELYKLIIIDNKLSIENKFLLYKLYFKIYKKDIFNLFDNYSIPKLLKENIIGQYGFESECSRLYWNPISYTYKIEHMVNNVFNMDFAQDLAVDVPDDYLKIEMKSKIIKSTSDIQNLFCAQQFLQLHGVTKRGGDDHIHIGIKQLDAKNYGLPISDKLFHIEVIKRILIYFVRYWDIFSKVAHGDNEFDYVPFEENINSRLDFIHIISLAKNIEDIMNIVQNRYKKEHQKYTQRYTIFNLITYAKLGTLEIRCFTLKGYAKQVVEGYGNIHGIKLCDTILKQALDDVVNLYNNNIKLPSKNENVKNAFLEYEFNVLKYNKYFKELQLEKSK